MKIKKLIVYILKNKKLYYRIEAEGTNSSEIWYFLNFMFKNKIHSEGFKTLILSLKER